MIDQTLMCLNNCLNWVDSVMIIVLIHNNNWIGSNFGWIREYIPNRFGNVEAPSNNSKYYYLYNYTLPLYI